jgi:hypothetical protein
MISSLQAFQAKTKPSSVCYSLAISVGLFWKIALNLYNGFMQGRLKKEEADLNTIIKVL